MTTAKLFTHSLILFLCLWQSFAVKAVELDEQLPDPVLEQRAQNLGHKMRCMVCQNQSIEQSSAPLAHDMRMLIREKITEGASDQEITQYLVAKYGEFILLEPTFSDHNLLLWLSGPLALLVGGFSVWLLFRRRYKLKI